MYKILASRAGKITEAGGVARGGRCREWRRRLKERIDIQGGRARYGASRPSLVLWAIDRAVRVVCRARCTTVRAPLISRSLSTRRGNLRADVRAESELCPRSSPVKEEWLTGSDSGSLYFHGAAEAPCERHLG